MRTYCALYHYIVVHSYFFFLPSLDVRKNDHVKKPNINCQSQKGSKNWRSIHLRPQLVIKGRF